MIANKKTLLIIVFILLSTSFFGAFKLNPAAIILLLLVYILHLNRKKPLFLPHIFVIYFGIAISFLPALFIREQSLLHSAFAVSSLFFLLSYFLFRRLLQSTEQVGLIINIVTFIFIICYLIQYILYPMPIFLGAEKEFADGDVRIRLTGQAIIFLGFFYNLNIILVKRFSAIRLFFLISIFFVVILMGFRSVIAALIFFSLYLHYKVAKFDLSTLVKLFILLLGVAAIYFIPEVNQKIERLFERNEVDNFGNEDYIRILQFDYFTNEHVRYWWEYFTGTGMPYTQSKYGMEVAGAEARGLWWVDWGLLGLFLMIGFFPVFAMIYYSLYIGLKPISNDTMFVSVWFLFLVSISIFTMEFFRPGNFVIQGFVLAIYERLSAQRTKF